MRCLYCGKLLGLLKELTDGEFCCGRHRLRYQKLGTLALSQLIEASPDAAEFRKPSLSRPQGLRAFPSTPPLNPALSGWCAGLLPSVDGMPHRPESRLRPLAMGLRGPRVGRRPILALTKPVLGQAMAAWPGLQLTPSAGPEPPVMAHLEPSVLFTARLAMGSVFCSSQPAADAALRSAGPKAVNPPVQEPVPATCLSLAEPLAFRPEVLHRMPASLQLSTVDIPLPAATGAISHTPCTEPLPWELRARASASCCVPMSGTDWHPWTARPRFSTAPWWPVLGTNLATAPLQAAPEAPPASAEVMRGAEPLALPVPRVRLPVLRAAPVSLKLRAEDSVAEEVPGADLAPSLAAVAPDPHLGSTSMLPALASLFRFGRTSRVVHPLPPVVEGVAPRNRAGSPLAYMELPMSAKGLVIPKESGLRIEETFEYLRPLEDPSFDLLHSLLRLWNAAPVYLRFATASACLMLLLWASTPGGGVNTVIARRLTGIEESIQNRATVEFSEDFQDGMQNWKGKPGWERNWRVEQAGYVHPGHLALYQPSMQMESYRMEFLVKIEKQAVGWVYRATDQENYYAAKITIVKPGPLPVLSLVRYPVIGGKEGPRVEIPIRVLMHNNTPYRVELTVNGTDFSTSIEGQLVDFWRDDRLKRGGVGFFSDSGEMASLYWMKVAQQDDFVGRVCAYFYPNPEQGRSVKQPQ